MSEQELTPEVFTADYVGEPGGRTFFLQAQVQGTPTSFLVEKQQVAMLAERLREVLLMIDAQDTIISAVPSRDPGLTAIEPVEPVWRAGDMGIAYDEGDDMVVLVLEEAAPDDPEASSARIVLRRDQARSFLLHSIAVVGEGRPICQLCGLPMDPGGHRCPASNGHHPRAAES